MKILDSMPAVPNGCVLAGVNKYAVFPTYDDRIMPENRTNIKIDLISGYNDHRVVSLTRSSIEKFLDLDSRMPGTVLISFREWLHSYKEQAVSERFLPIIRFSSLSESGFIPTWTVCPAAVKKPVKVLISFREWLHSYLQVRSRKFLGFRLSSHLFQRVASFLLRNLHTKQRDS